MEYLLLVSVLSILSLILWFWALIDIVKSRFAIQYGNSLWLFLIIILPVIGPLVYFLLKRKMTIKKKRQFKPKFHNL